MFFFVWLWNPWEKYHSTRHNIGFLFLDYLHTHTPHAWTQWKYESRYKADISQWVIHNKKVFLIKPQTYMNLSGQSLEKISQFLKVDSKHFTVIYDDKDMDFWKMRFRSTGSSGWHNGVKDIIRYFWEEWNRYKIGVGKTPEVYQTADWVLSRFHEEELIELESNIFPEIYTQLLENIFKK